MKKNEIFLSLLSVAGLWLIFTQLNNTLSHNGNWIVTKSHLGKSVYGSKEYVSGRQALAHNRLDLGAWYGYQEVVLKDSYPVHTFDMDFHLDTGSYIYFEFNRTEKKLLAVRLSGTSDFPSSFLTIKDSGEFIQDVPLKLPILSTGIWHNLHVIFDSRKQTVLLSIDGKAIDPIHTILNPNQSLGFRGSYRQVLVDNVYLRNERKTIVFHDDFSYSLNGWRDAGLCAILLMVFLALCTIKIKDRMMCLLGLCIAVGIIVGYIWCYFLTSYPDPNSSLGKLRDMVLKTDEAVNARNENLANNVIRNHSVQTESILFIGTSQTWGAGAMDDDRTFVAVAAADARKEGMGLAFINAGISGVDSSVLLDFYRNKWIKIKPRLCIINLSNNDIRDEKTFKKNLRSFVHLNKEGDIKTIFMLEANSPEAEPRSVLLHHAMVKVGNDEGVPVINIHEYLSQKDKKGFLWWDNVHLTSYGQELVGHYIYEVMKKMFLQVE